MAFIARQCRSHARSLVNSLRCGQIAAVKPFSTGSEPASEGDIVLEAFKEQQQSYRFLLDGMKKVKVPLDLEPGAVKQFANEMEALKKKAGMPDQQELIDATLEYQLKVSHGDIRKFIQDSVAELGLGDKPGIDSFVTKLSAALDKAEAAHGPVAESQAALSAFQASVKELAQTQNLSDINAIKSEAITEMYTQQLKAIRDEAAEEVEIAKRRDNLEGLQVDLSSVKPDFA